MNIAEVEAYGHLVDEASESERFTKKQGICTKFDQSEDESAIIAKDDVRTAHKCREECEKET